jgi:hypothetical protein
VDGYVVLRPRNGSTYGKSGERIVPISVACRCGKQFKVKDEHAGKRGKCPACGDLLVIPGPSADVPAARQSHAQTDDPVERKLRRFRESREQRERRELAQWEERQKLEWQPWGYRKQGLECPLCGASDDHLDGVMIGGTYDATSGDIMGALMGMGAAMEQAQDRKCDKCGGRFQSRWAPGNRAPDAADFYEWRPGPAA